MTWFRMPLFLWATYATSIIQVLATPVLGITLLLLIFERTMHIGVFDPAWGGDPVLMQHFFWFYSHPAVYIMILPAMGVMSEIGEHFLATSAYFLATASASHSPPSPLPSSAFWSGRPPTCSPTGSPRLMNTIFSFLTMLVAIPSAIKMWNWLATMYKGSIDMKTPMCYACSFIFLFAIGGLTGIFLGTLNTDVHLHDTYFVIAHFHYVMFGGTIIMFIGGIHYWWPKMTGRMAYNDNHWPHWAACSCSSVLTCTFLPQFVMGTHGMSCAVTRLICRNFSRITWHVHDRKGVYSVCRV